MYSMNRWVRFNIGLDDQLILTLGQQMPTGLEREFVREVTLDGARDDKPDIINVHRQGRG
jgi:hypothetical protein